MTKPLKGRNYGATHEEIKNTYIDIIKAENRMPTQQEVADKCHIARQTVNVHLSKINLSELAKPFKVFGNHVLMGLANKARKGDAQAAKLFFMLVYDWNEKHEVKGELDVKHKGGFKIAYEEVPTELARRIGKELAEEKAEE